MSKQLSGSAPSLVAVLALASTVACVGEPRTEAPEDLDGLARFLWTHQADATDEELDDALTKMHDVMSELLSDDEAKVGPLASLTEEDLVPVGLDGVNDPAGAPGLYLANRFTCDLDVLAEILTHPDQPAVHDGVYDSYDRVFVNDRDAWLAREETMLEWDVTYEATPTATQYLAKTKSGVRHLPKMTAPVGPALLQRTVLKEPAVFDGEPDNHVFDQDYQSELFYDDGDGQVVHLYGLWRFMQLGAISIHDDIFIDFQVNGMITWDEQTEAACATWPELPAR